MWTEDLHWAWKLRDEKRQKEKQDGKCNSAATEEDKKLWKIYAADITNEFAKADEDQIVISECTKLPPVR